MVLSFGNSNSPSRKYTPSLGLGPTYLGPPTRTFQLLQGMLLRAPNLAPPGEAAVLYEVVVGLLRSLATGPTKFKYIAKLSNQTMVTKHYSWCDGQNIFETDTKHLRLIQNTKPIETYVSLAKWDHYTTWDPIDNIRWNETWLPFRSAKLNCFLIWKIHYRVTTTYAWRWRQLPLGSIEKDCKRCSWLQPKQLIIVYGPALLPNQSRSGQNTCWSWWPRNQTRDITSWCVRPSSTRLWRVTQMSQRNGGHWLGMLCFGSSR